ncbi:MAG: SpoIIE family protein phosphatase [Rhodobacteraceae bacterium]|nr:SpoIIE family protein phosphatase [Paracoccaceae bacterium]
MAARTAINDLRQVARQVYRPRRALVVDDSPAHRKLLAAQLRRMDFEVTEADDGAAGLDLCRSISFDIVISDWVMPGLDGIGFCVGVRALRSEDYCYFILLTSKTGKEDVARGLDVGADDFLSKPVSPTEFRARISAGIRVVEMQRELADKTRTVSAALDTLQSVYDALDRDLIEARKLQMTLVRERTRDFGAGRIAALLRPSGRVGGDLVGWFQVNARRVGFYAIDVSGHGVASAMLAARLAGILTSVTPEANVALSLSGRNRADPWPPEVAAARLNRLLIDQIGTDQYLTCIYAETDLKTGKVALVQAGHPHPYVLRADGTVERVGQGGLPIGLIAEARYSRVEVVLQPGDRLLLMSDGLTEATDGDGQELGEDEVVRLALAHRDLPLDEMLEAMVWRLSERSGSTEFADDVSAVAYEFTGGADVPD